MKPREKENEIILSLLSTEETLKQIWAEFDREQEERRERLRAGMDREGTEEEQEGGGRDGWGPEWNRRGDEGEEGNHVLGAWEEEDALWDLDKDERHW